jgi:peptidoglycan/LPS O-acetylase OafA/YrhL
LEQRRPWIDNVRTAVILLVVNMHCCVTYSHVGDWYLKDGPEGTLSQKLPYIFWIFHLQSFFMGLLFFVAGSLADAAIDRHGARSFWLERLRRLGVPALLYMSILHPLIVFGLLGYRSSGANASWLTDYFRYFATGQVFSGSGPLWFVLALLLFSTVLATWRALTPRPSHPARQAPRLQSLVLFALVLAITTFVVRAYFPIGTSVLNFQLCYFPQYIAAFAAGVAAHRQGWLETLVSSKRARNAGWLALLGGPLLLGILLFVGGGPTEGPHPGEHGPIMYFGGWNLSAFGAAIWEQLTGVGLALGMLAWFKRRFDLGGRLAMWLARRSFGVYLFHAPIAVALTLLFRRVDAGQFPKIVLLTVCTTAASLVVAGLARRTPALRLVV